MEQFIKKFERDAKGVWRCVAPATLELPTGKIHVTPGTVLTRGTTFMGLDVAQMLEGQHALQQRL